MRAPRIPGAPGLMLAGLILAGVVLAGLALAGPAAARTIGLVYDDSGSMAHRKQTTHFAARILGAMLDPAKDRLVVVTMSNPGKAVELRGEAMAGLPGLARADGKTPARAVATLLETMAKRGDDDIALVVLTDGAFDADYQAVKQEIPHLRSRFNAQRINAWFIAISDDDETLDAIAGQGLKDVFLTEFWGDAKGRYKEVREQKTLHDAITEVALSLADGEDAAKGGFATVDGPAGQIRIDSVLPTDHIVVIMPGGRGAPAPGLKDASFDLGMIHDSPGPLVQMDEGDRVNPRPLQAKVQHFRFQRVLQPGSHTLGFDGPLPAGTKVLLHSTALAHWRLLDAAGREVAPGPGNRHEIEVDHTYRIEAKLYQDASRNVELPLDELAAKGLEFHLYRTVAGTQTPDGRMAIDRGGNLAWAPLSFSQPGDHTANVVARLKGLFNHVGRTLTVKAVKPNAQVSWSCTDCDNGIASRPLGTDPKGAHVAELAASVSAELPGTYDLAVEGLPPGLRVVRDGSGAPDLTAAAPAAPVKLGKGDTLRLEVVAGPDAAALVGKPVPLRFTLTARRPLLGGHAHAITAVVGKGEVALRVIDHTLPDKAAPFALSKTALGEDGLVVKIDGLDGPADPAHFRVTSRLGGTVGGQGPDRVLVKPLPPWGITCAACVLPTGPTPLELIYDDGARHGKVAAQVTLLEASWLEWLRACGPWLLALLLLLYLAVVAARLHIIRTARRFPPLAKVTMVPRRLGERVEIRRLRQGNAIYWQALRPWGTLKFETARVHAATVRAKLFGSVEVLPDGGASDLLYQGRRLSDLFQENSGRPISVPYGGTDLSDRDFQRIVFDKK